MHTIALANLQVITSWPSLKKKLPLAECYQNEKLAKDKSELGTKADIILMTERQEDRRTDRLFAAASRLFRKIVTTAKNTKFSE